MTAIRALMGLVGLLFLIGCASADDRTSTDTDANTDSGTLIKWEPQPSEYVAPRQVTIWLPPGYETGNQRFPVLYMHDGQNLFEADTSYGGVEWGVDETMTALIAAGRIRPAIVVGIWNGGPLRSREYVPAKVIGALPDPMRAVAVASHRGEPLSDAYLRYLTRELKPRIDQEFRTLAGRDDTYIMGSSFGGVISLYALGEYPDVFSKAVAFSTHWPSVPRADLIYDRDGFSAAMISAYATYIETSGLNPDHQYFWTDTGTTELDALYAPFHAALVPVLEDRGFRQGDTLTARVYEGTGHHERYWQARFSEAAHFLLAVPGE